MGRAGAIGQQPSPIQSHRSNVATFSATGKTQGQPNRQQQPRLPDDGSQPPAPPIDVTGNFDYLNNKISTVQLNLTFP